MRSQNGKIVQVGLSVTS